MVQELRCEGCAGLTWWGGEGSTFQAVGPAGAKALGRSLAGGAERGHSGSRGRGRECEGCMATKECGVGQGHFGLTTHV